MTKLRVLVLCFCCFMNNSIVLTSLFIIFRLQIQDRFTKTSSPSQKIQALQMHISGVVWPGRSGGRLRRHSTHRDSLVWLGKMVFRQDIFSSVFFWGALYKGGILLVRTSSLVGPSPFRNASAPSKARGPALEFSGTVFKGDTWLGVLTFLRKGDGRTNSRREWLEFSGTVFKGDTWLGVLTFLRNGDGRTK
jgi:hypothetical protein